MAATLPPRVVVVTRPSAYELLLRRHGTRDQARFFLETRGQCIESAERTHRSQEAALQTVVSGIPTPWRRAHVTRSDLDRFLFEPEDVVLAVGQDGLVPNVAKYLTGQPVIGVNPDRGLYEGVLVRHSPAEAVRLLAPAAAGEAPLERRTLVETVLDDGLALRALNEVFVGHRSHQSARYRLRWNGKEERQSSSGLIVSTGTGATGWALSVNRERARSEPLPDPTSETLVYFVREAWPSVASGTELTQGLVSRGQVLEIVSEMGEGGVIFGDGIESDPIEFGWGVRALVGVSGVRLHLVLGE